MPGILRSRPRTVAILVAGAFAAVPVATAQADVTLRHAKSGFSVKAPEGSKLTIRKGVYTVRNPAGWTITYSRSISSTKPAQFGAALLSQLGGAVVSRSATKSRFTAEVNVGARRETVVAWRSSGSVAVITGTSAVGAPLSLASVSSIGRTARGGVKLRPPRRGAKAIKPLAMTSYRAPDGGATAEVPRGWQVESSQGAIAGSSKDGAFLLGFSINIFPPGIVPGGTSALVFPYQSAIGALVNVLPNLTIGRGITDVRVRSVLVDAIFPSFNSSGMIAFDYKVNGKQWTGVATVATDPPAKFSNFVWNMYYSGIGVPVRTSPAVGAALLRTWRTWNPSGAIAQRTQLQRELLNQTNDIWRQTSEFRSQTADRQARDVGCLLSGYYVIEDNSRRYDLPPLPCGQVYTKR